MKHQGIRGKNGLIPNENYDHAYAVVRVDKCRADGTLDFYDTDYVDFKEIPHTITIKKIVWKREDADKEVKRLNDLVELNKDGSCLYFSQLTRIEKKDAIH